MVKIEDILVWTDDECLSSSQDPMPSHIWKNFQINWLRKFPIIYISPKGRYICIEYFIFLICSNIINSH